MIKIFSVLTNLKGLRGLLSAPYLSWAKIALVVCHARQMSLGFFQFNKILLINSISVFKYCRLPRPCLKKIEYLETKWQKYEQSRQYIQV